MAFISYLLTYGATGALIRAEDEGEQMTLL